MSSADGVPATPHRLKMTAGTGTFVFTRQLADRTPPLTGGLPLIAVLALYYHSSPIDVMTPHLIQCSMPRFRQRGRKGQSKLPARRTASCIMVTTTECAGRPGDEPCLASSLALATSLSTHCLFYPRLLNKDRRAREVSHTDSCSGCELWQFETTPRRFENPDRLQVAGAVDRAVDVRHRADALCATIRS